MKYIIEGTIKELSFDENFFTIAGTEGYAIKQKKDGMEMKYNVLKSFEDDDTAKVFIKGLVCKQDVKFSTVGKNRNLLLQAASFGKRIRITIKINDSKVFGELEIDKQKISSLALLAE